MSQDERNRPQEQGQNSRNGNEGERKRPEGFEGMNYEQRRQPYQPRRVAKTEGHEEQRGNEGAA